MLRVQDKAHVERAFRRLAGLFAIQHVEEVARRRASLQRFDRLHPLTHAIERRDDSGYTGKNAERLGIVGVHEHVVRLRIIERKRRRHRAQDGRWIGVLRRELDHVQHALRQDAKLLELRLKLFEFLLIRKMSLPEQMGDFLKARVGGQVEDVVASIYQNSGLSVDERKLRVERDDSFETSSLNRGCRTTVGALLLHRN